MAQQKNPNLKEPVLPYADNHVVGDFNGISNGNVNISWSTFWLKFDSEIFTNLNKALFLTTIL